MTSFKITPRARDDLKKIARYTEIQWGKAQRTKYLRALEKSFHRLALSPRLGKLREDVAEGYFSFPQGRHVIFYIIQEKHISIIGSPHKDMDTDSYFLHD